MNGIVARDAAQSLLGHHANQSFVSKLITSTAREVTARDGGNADHARLHGCRRYESRDGRGTTPWMGEVEVSPERNSRAKQEARADESTDGRGRTTQEPKSTSVCLPFMQYADLLSAISAFLIPCALSISRYRYVSYRHENCWIRR